MKAKTAPPDRNAAVEALIREASALVAARDAKIPPRLVDDLFSHAIAEDLLRYSADELAELTVRAAALLASRTAGQPTIRLEAPAPSGGEGALSKVSVLEIVNDDMPFLFDSVLGEIASRNLELMLAVHPVVSVTRDASLRLTAYGDVPGARRESFIHIHLPRIDDPDRQRELISALQSILADVRVSVQDWQAMLARTDAVRTELMDAVERPVAPNEETADDMAEAVAFLDWLRDENFIFLGVRDYVFAANDLLEPVFESGLGLLRSRTMRILRRVGKDLEVTPEVKQFMKQRTPLIVRKSAVRGHVHRRAYMDYVGIKRFDAAGNVIGEFRILGLFTSTAYTGSSSDIPFLRRKVAAVFQRAGYDPRSHSGKALMNVLDTFPRDEMFQIDDDTLFRFAMAITELEGRSRVRVLSRRDEFSRFVSVLVFVPRDRYSSSVQAAVGGALASAFKGHVSETYPSFPEGPNVRIQYIIGRKSGATPNPDSAALETMVAALVRNWSDGFDAALKIAGDNAHVQNISLRYRDAFSAGYRDRYAPETTVADLSIIERLTDVAPRGVMFYPRDRETGPLGLKIWSRGEPLSLTRRVPVLENMGFRVVDERTHEIRPKDSPPVWFHDMTLYCSAELAKTALPARKAQLESCFLAVMGGTAEDDGYNALVLLAGIGWRDVALLRALSRYLRQIVIPYSQDYMWETLRKHAQLASLIVELFYARFDPRLQDDARKAKEEGLLATIETALEAVQSLDEDRIVRRFVNAVRSALRTNYFQLGADGMAQPVIAIKFDSRALEGLPAPRPLVEITVYSPRVEGIHLRFGKVARGGIRWSDRPQDFRTEVLGLVKAQQVKNAVIVPVGAKGGFVPKWLSRLTTREEIAGEGVAAYKLFIQSLLDVTDNVETSGIGHPANVVRHDADDPYLVVAADKGTATFSDIANGIARDNHFWLDDAFASGGSAGYDHKKMGITARGAWESVKRHFREMDTDIHTTPFTAVGVGDMSGDVFGNGMLREETTKLVAAFDHRDIFIDPNPDPAASFVERQRLFDLPRSSWQDYDKALISEGGGIHSRSLKQIELSPQAQAALGFTSARATPQEVMRAILQAPVDLLFFGGIGTYIRAAAESDAAVGDRANDAIRITGAQVRARVIGEGANLGMTQRGRIEAALRGIRLNTDAIDNSAGVNTSDVEVNIKIATAGPVRDKTLTLEARNELLASMTDDVAALVLRNNYQQTQSISLTQRHGMNDFGFQQRLMQTLEQRHLLDRAVEFLPDDMELAERRRRGQPLSRPELSVLLAYAKLTLKSELLASDVPDQAYLARELVRYFPHQLVEGFPDTLKSHRLRREIISTQLASSLINRGGPALVVRLSDQTGASPSAIALAFTIVRDSYALIALNTDIELLDNRIASETQMSLFSSVQDLLVDRMVWFLRHGNIGGDPARDLAEIIAHYQDGIAAVDAALTNRLPEDLATARDARLQKLTDARVPRELAWRIASLPVLTSAPDIVLVAAQAKRPIADVAATYFAVNSHFRVSEIVELASAIPVSDYFDRLALDRALDNIEDAERKITASVVAEGGSGSDAVEAWANARGGRIERVRGSINEISATGLTLSKVTLAANLLGDLAGG